jgi:hypothetical protein
MAGTAAQTTSLASRVSSVDALRIAEADARTAYGDLSIFTITVVVEEDGWHIDYEVRKPGMKGGGPHYVIDAGSGQILSKRYEQ